MRSLPFIALAFAVAGSAACSDSTGPSGLSVKSGDKQTAPAGTPLPSPIVIAGTGGENVTFAVVAGGGTLSSTTGTVNADGTVTAPTWTLGKSAVPQQLEATIGGRKVEITATIQTSYKIDVRFFGRAMPAAQQALFTNAANRIRAIIVGQVPMVNVAGTDVAKECEVTGVPPLTGNVDGILIYASIDSIDGKSKILAQSGPCFVRVDDNNQLDFRTSIGVMKFDSADINSLAGSGNLQEVITHEMLHVVGFGSFWAFPGGDSAGKVLLINPGADVRYTGAGGIAGCQAIGGLSTCATSVPVEGAQGGDGTINSHWRETTFDNELMTGFLNNGTNPLSKMSIKSLEDLDYTVDVSAADPFTIPGGSIRASFRANDVTATSTPGAWEKPLPRPPRGLPTVWTPQSLRSN
jgi:leishmanolysin